MELPLHIYRRRFPFCDNSFALLNISHFHKTIKPKLLALFINLCAVGIICSTHFNLFWFRRYFIMGLFGKKKGRCCGGYLWVNRWIRCSSSLYFGWWGKTKLTQLSLCGFLSWWRRSGSNRLPLECHSSALPGELRPHLIFYFLSFSRLLDYYSISQKKMQGFFSKKFDFLLKKTIFVKCS